MGLIRDLMAFGVAADADKAAKIMNCHGAVEIEKISAPRPALPNAEIGEETPVRDPSTQTGSVRSPGTGACLFVW